MVEPLGAELTLRNREWVEGNLRKVEKATGGKVGYIYVPDTAGPGMTYFKRYFFPQVDKDALIVDERFNGGGQIADYYIDILRRPFASYWAPRYGAEWRSPSAAVFGPKVMIADEGRRQRWRHAAVHVQEVQAGAGRGQAYLGRLGGHQWLPDPHGRWQRDRTELRHLDSGKTASSSRTKASHRTTMWTCLPKDVLAGKDAQLEKAIELALESAEEGSTQGRQAPGLPEAGEVILVGCPLTP